MTMMTGQFLLSQGPLLKMVALQQKTDLDAGKTTALDVAGVKPVAVPVPASFASACAPLTNLGAHCVIENPPIGDFRTGVWICSSFVENTRRGVDAIEELR